MEQKQDDGTFLDTNLPYCWHRSGTYVVRTSRSVQTDGSTILSPQVLRGGKGTDFCWTHVSWNFKELF